MPKRAKVVHIKKTQDTLIREALELEERNVAALKEFLGREEEKKRQAKVVRAKVEQPLLRWISRTEDVPVPGVQMIDDSIEHTDITVLQQVSRRPEEEGSRNHPTLVSGPGQRATPQSEPLDSSLVTVGDPTNDIPKNRCSRNYVVLELSRGGGRRMKEMVALFGRHADWSATGTERQEETRQRLAGKALSSS